MYSGSCGIVSLRSSIWSFCVIQAVTNPSPRVTDQKTHSQGGSRFCQTWHPPLALPFYTVTPTPKHSAMKEPKHCWPVMFLHPLCVSSFVTDTKPLSFSVAVSRFSLIIHTFKWALPNGMGISLHLARCPSFDSCCWMGSSCCRKSLKTDQFMGPFSTGLLNERNWVHPGSKLLHKPIIALNTCMWLFYIRD